MKKKYLQIILLLILVASTVFYKLQTGRDYLPEMIRMAGEGSELKKLSGHIYEANQNGEVIGYLEQQSAAGYAGPIDVIVFIGKDGKVKDISVVHQTETPSFFSTVLSKGFIDTLLGKNANSQFELGQDLDGVTGATYTSRGIAEAVRKASQNIAVAQLKMEVPQTAKLKITLAHYLIITLLFAVFIFYKFNLNKLRYVTLAAGFLLIGYWEKSLLTLGNIATVISGNIPWQNIPFWLILLLGVLGLIIITGRNLYCYWMCPYGALSELLGSFGKFGRIDFAPCPRSQQRFKQLRLFLAWIALVFAFTMKNPSISSYEIFTPLFALEGTPAQWLLLPIMLLLGVFIFRFWCRFFCPVGGLLDFLVKCRRSCVCWGDNQRKTTLIPTQVSLIGLGQNSQEKK